MRCQILFSGKNKKFISKCLLLKILPRVLSLTTLMFSWQNLKLEMDDKDTEVTQLNEDANEMLSKAPSGSLQDLARSLMRMNALWTHTYQQVEHYSRLYLTSDQQWREFKGKGYPGHVTVDLCLLVLQLC